MGLFDKRKKNKNDDRPEEKDGAILATAMSFWQSLPVLVKLKIIGVVAAVAVVIILMVGVLGAIPSLFLDYSDDAQNTKDIPDEYREYWAELCEDEDAGCTEEQIAAAKKLKESQTAFYTKLDSLVKKNNITAEQKYIVLTTVFYNYQIDDFTAGAFDIDDNDDINYDSSNNGENVYQREKDTLKELIKQFKVNTAFCEYTTKNDAGEDVKKTETLRSPSGSTYSFNFFDNVKFTFGILPAAEGFAEAKEACEALTSGRVYMEVSSSSAASIDGYYRYLKESDFLDDRPMNAPAYLEHAKKYGLSEDISSWPEEEKILVREAIIKDIKSIVAAHTPTQNKNMTYLAVGHDTAYWWPIGSSEVIESNGKYYATGTPYPNVVTSEGGGRIDPISGKPATHSGMDIAPIGAAPGVVPVIAAKSGTVVFPDASTSVGYGNGTGIGGSTYGNYIRIQHTDGNYTLYAHLHANSILVRTGDSVEQGQVIAYVGNSGRSTGTHLHFEVREGQDSYYSVTDPRKYISEENPRPQSSVSQDFVAWFDANFEGSTGTDSTGTKYLVKDVGDGVRTVGPGVTLDAQRNKFLERGINVDEYPNGTYIDIEIVDSIKSQILEEAASSIETTISNAGLTLEKEKIEALVVFKYNVGNISGFTEAYKKYGDTQALYDNYFGQYVHVKGEVWPGLVKRRQKEWELFHNHVYV